MNLLSALRALGDRVLGWSCVGLGLLALLLGYLGVKDTAYVAEQLPYVVSGGLVGLFLLGTGGVLLLSADLRDQWRALIDIRDELAKRSDAASLRSLLEEPVGAPEPEGAPRPRRRASS